MKTNPIIEKNKQLQNYNTFRVAAKAQSFIEIKDTAALTTCYQENLFKKQPILVLGGGSNILFTQDFEGLVVHMQNKGIAIKENDNQVLVTAAAGENWADLVSYCVSKNYAGMENLSLIPGCVGASPIQNIGAYGVELQDIFHSLEAFEIQSGNLITFNKSELCFDYRHSIFKEALQGEFIITSVTYQLSRQAILKTHYGSIQTELQNQGIKNPTLQDVSQVVSAIRLSKLPQSECFGNAGSFFKNPSVSRAELAKLQKQLPGITYYPEKNGIKLAAASLIEACGWKGRQIGRVSAWKNQALVLVNHGGATGREIAGLADQIKTSVQTRFGITLVPEVTIL